MIEDFPISQDEMPVKAIRPVTRTEPLILVVVEDVVRAFTWSTILTNCGFRNIGARHGFAALELAAKTPPRLLIADVSLPGMTGLQLAFDITRAIPGCDAILIAGLGSPDDFPARSLEHNFPILFKPVQPADLLSCIRECLATSGPKTTPGDQNGKRLVPNNNLAEISSVSSGRCVA